MLCTVNRPSPVIHGPNAAGQVPRCPRARRERARTTGRPNRPSHTCAHARRAAPPRPVRLRSPLRAGWRCPLQRREQRQRWRRQLRPTPRPAAACERCRRREARRKCLSAGTGRLPCALPPWRPAPPPLFVPDEGEAAAATSREVTAAAAGDSEAFAPGPPVPRLRWSEGEQNEESVSVTHVLAHTRTRDTRGVAHEAVCASSGRGSTTRHQCSSQRGNGGEDPHSRPRERPQRGVHRHVAPGAPDPRRERVGCHH
mmetsp:Transcript_15092/g.45004  ORF Transcript_15092/g.45004 Transcript_15092/m.45004 type:complete len:256 (+) Transcript_15092:250-1017(+)